MTPSDYPTNFKILIVDDDEAIRSQMRWALSKDYEVLEAEDRPSAVKRVAEQKPLVVLLDLGLPPKAREAEEGFLTLQEILKADPDIKVIMITGNTDRENALKAVDLGAFDFFPKPPVMDEVRIVIKRAFRMSQLERENRTLRIQMEASGSDGLEGLIGTSSAIQAAFQTIRKVATVDVPVLILGESGTGKELAARAIHRLSHRRQGPFVVINCGAIPETLLESELFGHEKGSFTGADSRRKGRIEYAEGGTLLLDEIGELGLLLQVKLLRFLQEHAIERLGGRETISLNVRVLAATNRNLQKEVEAGRFREDLFYRLSVVTLSIPPLRERTDDIYLLARTFLNRYAREFKKNISGFEVEAIRLLSECSWHGNVRELENRVKRAVVMTEGEWVTATDLGFSSTLHSAKLPSRLREAREVLEQQMITYALERNQGVIIKTAEELGISRQSLADLIKKHNISIE